MLSCPSCGWPVFSVVSSRDSARAIRRWRECRRCKTRWATVEIARADLPPGMDPIIGRLSDRTEAANSSRSKGPARRGQRHAGYVPRRL
ncbi:hypothetical protein [Methylobacterium organophilum]|uniref:NrdR family transcriptional regulator n=1 Tax=Methylobacterium organophilum TaxID=410 RepID=UPI003B848C38